MRSLVVSLAFAAIIGLQTISAAAQEKIEGTVVSTKMTLCEFKPGGCEGDLVLERKGSGGKAESTTIRVPKGTLIKKGNDYAYLPTLRGSVVAVTYVTEKGTPVAKSIEVLKGRP